MTSCNTTSKHSRLVRLPFELLDEIAQYLDIRSFVQFTATCRQLKQLVPALLPNHRDASLLSAVRSGDVDAFRKQFAALRLFAIDDRPAVHKRAIHHLLHACQWVLAVELQNTSLVWWGPLGHLSDQFLDKSFGFTHPPVLDPQDVAELGSFYPRLLAKLVDQRLFKHSSAFAACCCYPDADTIFSLCTRVCRKSDLTQAERLKFLRRLNLMPAPELSTVAGTLRFDFVKALVETRELATIYSVSLSFGVPFAELWQATVALVQAKPDDRAAEHIFNFVVRSYVVNHRQFADDRPVGVEFHFSRPEQDVDRDLMHEFILHGIHGETYQSIAYNTGGLPARDFMASLLGVGGGATAYHNPTTLSWFLSHVHLHLHTLHSLPFNTECPLTATTLALVLAHVPIDVAGMAKHRGKPLTTPNILHETQCDRCHAIAQTIRDSPDFCDNPVLQRIANTEQWVVSYDPIPLETRQAEARALAEVLAYMAAQDAAAASAVSPWRTYFDFLMSDQVREADREHVHGLDWSRLDRGINCPDLATKVYIYCQGGQVADALDAIQLAAATVEGQVSVMDQDWVDWVCERISSLHPSVEGEYRKPGEQTKLVELVQVVHSLGLVDPMVQASTAYQKVVEWAETISAGAGVGEG